MTTNATTPALTEEEKYKRPKMTATDVATGSAIPAYLASKAVGGGSAWQGVKNTASAVGGIGKATGVAVGGAVQSAGGVRGVAGELARGAGKSLAPFMLASSGYGTLKTPTEDYYERFGLEKDTTDKFGLTEDVLVRGAGAITDVANAVSFGQLGKHYFNDKIRQNNEALAKEQANVQNSSTQVDKLKAMSEQMQKPTTNTQTNTATTIQIGGIGGIDRIGQGLENAPQAMMYQGGLKSENPNYQALMHQVGQAGQALNDSPPQPRLGIRTHAPMRSRENEQQRQALLRDATTVHKHAHGLTANQMRLAHELSNDDIKMAQERHLQQNNLNHQLQQEQLQQQGQNQRAMLGETGQMARAVMNEQGQNARFNTNFGLDVAKFNQDAQNSQYELGLKGVDLRSRLGSQALDDSAKAEQMSLYNQYINAKDDEQRDKILTQMAVLTGKGGGDKGDSFATMNLGEQYDPETQMTINRGQALYNTRTGQVVGGLQPQQQSNEWQDPKNMAAFEKEVSKSSSVAEKRAIAQKYGIPADIIAQYFGE